MYIAMEGSPSKHLGCKKQDQGMDQINLSWSLDWSCFLLHNMLKNTANDVQNSRLSLT